MGHMRPLHALLLLLVLVGLLVGSLLWLGGSAPQTEVAPPAPEMTGAPANTSTAAASDLSASEQEGTAPERAGIQSSASNLENVAVERSEVQLSGLRGRVVNAQGVGVADAVVYAAENEGMNFAALDALEPRMVPWMQRYDARTDAQGRFSMSFEPRAGARLAVRAAGFAPLDLERTLAAGELDVGDLTLEQGVILEGRITDPRGMPVADAELYSRPAGMGGMMMVSGMRGKPIGKSDAQGRFRIDRLASGPWRLLISSAEHPDKNVQGTTERPGERKTDLVFQLEEGAAIEGRVSGAEAQRLTELSVSAAKRNEGEDAGAGMMMGNFTLPRKAKVKADGSFRVGGLAPGASYRLSARKTESSPFNIGMGMGANDGVAAKAGDRNVEVPFTPEPALVCQVVDAQSGEPITEMDVKAGRGWNIPLMGSDGKLKRHFEAGRVRFENLPPRNQGFGPGNGASRGVKLRIDATGYKPFEKDGLEMPASGDLDLGVVRLERNPVCEVTILDAQTGAPVANAEVTLEKVTNDDREARGMRMGMRFMSRGAEAANDESSSRAKTNAQGKVRLQSFPGANARLLVEAKDYAAWNGTQFLLPAERDHSETLRLSRGGEILVRVVDERGAPVAGVPLEHRMAGEETDEEQRWMNMMTGSQRRSDARGEIVYAHQVVGTHQLRVVPRGNRAMFGGAMIAFAGENEDEPAAPWSNAVVTEGGRVELVLVTEPQCSLEGLVREAGRPLAGASIEVSEESNNFMGGFGLDPNSPRTDGQGRYKVKDLAPGRSKLIVRHASRAMAFEMPVDLVAGTNKLDVDLPSSTIEGTVRDAQGRGIPGVRVRAERYREGGGDRNVEMAISFAAAGGDEPIIQSFTGQESVETDADGRYTLRGVMSDTDLVVQANGKDSQPARSDKVRVAPDQVLSNVNLELKQGGTVEVKIKGATRENANSFGMIEGRRLDVENAAPQMQGVGRSGTARFRGLEPGKWSFKIMDMGFDPETGESKPPKESKTVEVEVVAGKTQKIELDPN